MRRTDLALEAREIIEGKEEISGVILEEENKYGNLVKVTKMKIESNHGSQIMGKPKGVYITIESKEEKKEPLLKAIVEQIKKIVEDKGIKKILVVGLGNREITPDALGPWVIDQLFVTRHLIKEFGQEFQKKYNIHDISAIAPGVMAQTGIESGEIIGGIIKKLDIDGIIAIDALAARKVQRLYKTIQITDTGISPGSGVGNNRKVLNKENLGVEVIAIGIPTVVDAETIVEDRVESSLLKAGFSQKEVDIFINQMVHGEDRNMFVTGKEVDEKVKNLSEILAEAINISFVKAFTNLS